MARRLGIVLAIAGWLLGALLFWAGFHQAGVNPWAGFDHPILWITGMALIPIAIGHACLYVLAGKS
jgi:hypothetical protein